ncbi:unnamed protein product [Wickerhamomyces anomalus]
MPEVINISLSQRANHLSTHFYNAQESYLDYTKSVSKADNNPNVFFKPTLSRDKSTVNYNPRALIWDLKGGFGALGQFEYFVSEEDEDEWKGKTESIARDRIPKSAYQKALDNNSRVPQLDTSNTLYWTDYSRVLYEPKAYNELKNWEVDPKNYPKGRLALGQEREFVDYQVGVEEWKNDYTGVSFLEDKYRTSLEECDSLTGLNVVSEVDSAWGGFTSEMLHELRDDYNPKNSLFTWGIFNGKKMEDLSNKEILSRIRTFLELQRSSSLFLPLATPKNLPESLNINRSSHWQTSVLQTLIFEPFQTITSQREHNVNFNTIEDNLTLGSQRRIVSTVKASTGNLNFDFANEFFVEAKNPHEFSRSSVHRPAKISSQEDFKDSSQEPGKSTSIEGQKVDKSQTDYSSKLPFGTPDSFPDFINPSDNVTATLGITTAPRKTLITMKTFVSKFVRGDDRENMIQELETLAEDYEHGWNDSDESDDDY